MMERELVDGERIFVIGNFLSPEECEGLIARSEAIGYETFSIDGEVFPEYRNNGRVMMEDSTLAETLWTRAAMLIPPMIDGQSASGLDPRFRFYRYRGREAFAPHYDGSARIGDQESKLTFMIYLNDVAQGGETRFYGPKATVRFRVRPERGKALVFEHRILHEGVPVEEGSKYVLRTDIMYETA